MEVGIFMNDLNDSGKLTLKREIGLFSAIAIVVGQMIGSGVFMAPQGLAEYANPAAGIIALCITGVGSLLLAICFAKISLADDSLKSPLAATQKALGEFPAFMSGWSYWCGCWVANGAIILGGLNYLSYFFPSLQGNSLPKYIITIIVIWFYTLLNIRGIKESSGFNLVITIIKILPLLVIIVVGFIGFDSANMSTVSMPENAGFGVIPVAMTYTLWSFVGFEGITVNAAEIKNPKIVMKGTVIGTVIVLGAYIVLNLLAAGNLPQADLYASESPFADMVNAATGVAAGAVGWGGGFISAAVCISAFGCIGAWIISGASIAFSLGEQGLMPAAFAKVHAKYRTPHVALIVNGILMTIIMCVAYFNQEGSIYNFFVMLSTLALLVFYAFGAASEIMLAGRGIKKLNVWSFIKNSIIALVAFLYSIFTIYGSGADYVMYGFLLILIGFPFYIYARLKRHTEGDTLN
jgi:amino acid transporter